MFGIKGRTDEEFFTKVLGDVIVPDFAPKESVNIAANGAEANQVETSYGDEMMEVYDECDQLFAALPKPSSLAGFH